MKDPMDMPSRRERIAYTVRYMLRGTVRKLLALGILWGVGLLVWVAVMPSPGSAPQLTQACKLAIQHERIVVGANNAIDANLGIAPVGHIYNQDASALMQVSHACPPTLPQGYELIAPSLNRRQT